MKAILARKSVWIFGVAALCIAAAAFFPSMAVSQNKGHIEGTVSFARGNANLVVYVDHASGTFHPPAKHVVMNQIKMAFVPHVLPIVVGTTVDFLNSDPIAHNVFSPDNEGYNLGTWKKGQKHSYTFKKTGVYTQLCSLHPEMEGFVIVLQNPYFAVTDKDGHFNIANVPSGHYVLKVWGEKLHSKDKKKTFSVDLHGASVNTSINL